MYELVRISFHNWYVFEALDLDVSGMIAVIGPTGAGKSAILDGIQVVVTGDNHNFIDLNPSAGEKSDRTVLSYCLGQITDFDRGAPRRERSETTLALTFQNQETGHPISIGLLLQGDHQERLETARARFIARGYAFSFADFIERDADGDEFVVSHEEIIDRLKRTCGKELSLHAGATQFVAEFLAAMRPRSSPEARLFLRSFNNAVLAREIRNPTDFVRRFVLEPEPLNVERIRSSIETWRSLEKRAEDLEAEIRSIRAVKGRFATWARQKVQAQTETFISHAAERMRLEVDIDALTKKKQHAETEAETTRALIADRVEAISKGSDEALRKRTLRSETAGASKLRAIDVEEQSANRARSRAEADFDMVLNGIREIAQLSAIRTFIPIKFHGALQAASDIAKAASERTRGALAADCAPLAEAATRAWDILGARDSLTQQRNVRISELADARREEQALGLSLPSSTDGRVSLLSPHVREFMADLAINGIQSIALPDIVEIADKSWATALEMLLGPNREALIVPDTQVEQAFQYLWRNRARWHGCRIVNTRKTRHGSARTLSSHSIAHVVRTDNQDARAFIETQVGRYIRVDSERELGEYDYAVMRNGKTTTALALRVYRDISPILGKSAQEAAISSARAKLQALRTQITEKETEQRLLDNAITILARLAAGSDAPTALRAASKEIQQANEKLAALKGDRDKAEDPESQALREDIERIEANVKTLEKELIELRDREQTASVEALTTDRTIGERQTEAAQAAEAAQTIEREQGSPRMVRLIAFAEADEFTIEKARARLAEEAFQKRGEEMRFLAERRDRARKTAEDQSRFADENGRRALREFNEYATANLQERNPLPGDADNTDYCFWCAEREQRLELHELRPHREKVIQARREFEAALKEDLLAKMSDRFDKVKTQREILNKRLSGYRFVGQRYQFKQSIAADFKPLYDLVRRIIGNQDASFATFTDAEGADEEVKRAMMQVEEIVTRDQDTKRLEDYRNYFEFELYLENENGEEQAFSKLVGLLSGGQRQAPYYVAIAASMVSVYFPKSGRDSTTDGMALVAFDEAFNKLDIVNTQNLIKLYRDLGLQVVIAAPEVHRATFLESVDCIISVTRMPNSDEVAVDAEQIGPRARAEMAAANPEHRGIEWFRTIADQPPQKAAE